MTGLGSTTYIFVGSFVMPKPAEHDGLHILRLDTATGTLTLLESHIAGLNVGGFVFDSRRHVLYLSNEVASTAAFRAQMGASGGGGGEIYAFRIDPLAGGLTEVGHWPSYGTQPAGVALDASGDFLVVSHFTSRSVTTSITGNTKSCYHIEPRYDDATTVLFPIRPDGTLCSPCDVYIHPKTALAPPSCLHSALASPSGSFFVECDMAKDQVLTFFVDTGSQLLKLIEKYDCEDNAGPRFSAFHPTLPVFYVNFEYGLDIETFMYKEDGSFHSIGRIHTLPEHLPNKPGVLLSDIRVHPLGHCVYTLARGHNVVCIFSVDVRSGQLQPMQTVALKAESPKGCVISPDGKFLLVAASVSNVVQVWRIQDDGQIIETNEVVRVPRPSAMMAVRI